MSIETKIRVVIADDHEMTRDGLRMLLENDYEIELVGEAADGEQLLKMVKKYNPDVVVTDLKMPVMEGIEAIRIMHREGIQRILAFTMSESPYQVVEALEAGAMGCVVKNAPGSQIIEAIKTVYKYGRYYCQSTSAMMARQIFKSRSNPTDNEGNPLFSIREKEIIRQICKGKSSEEMAEFFFMSKRTLEGVRRRIMAKMNVKSIVELVIYAIRHSIFQWNSDDDFTIN